MMKTAQTTMIFIQHTPTYMAIGKMIDWNALALGCHVTTTRDFHVNSPQNLVACVAFKYSIILKLVYETVSAHTEDFSIYIYIHIASCVSWGALSDIIRWQNATWDHVIERQIVSNYQYGLANIRTSIYIYIYKIHRK